jgi:hypothetical protein
MRDNLKVSHLRGFTLVLAVGLASIGVGVGALAVAGTTESTVSDGQAVKVWSTRAALSGPLSLVTTNVQLQADGTVQLARHVGSREVAVGPPLVSFEWGSGTFPVTASASGVVWVFELGSSTPPTVWRISDTSGAVLQKTVVPEFLRPSLAADSSGLYFGAFSASGGSVDDALIFHVGIGARKGSTVLPTSRALPAAAQYVASMYPQHGVIVANICRERSPCYSVMVPEIS